MRNAKMWKKVLKQMVVGLLAISMIIPGLTGVVSANTAIGEIRWDFIEGTENVSAYKEGTDTVTVSGADGALQVNATNVTNAKSAGFYTTGNFTIDGDIHKYIVIKADLPANISKIAAYLYNTDTQANNYMYGWANNDNSIQAGITTGTNTYALRLSEAHTKSGGPDTQVADGTYNKLEIRFICNAALSEQVISVDYVAISGYNKDAVLCGGNNTTSVVGADEKPVIISGLNIGSNDYALNETDKGYTECGMSSGYESLETANITATAAIGWTVNNTATTVTTLENHKVVDAVVTATNGSETKTASYRYVFSSVETTGEIRWDFIEGTENASAYKEGTDTVTVSSADGALQVNATNVTNAKSAGFYTTGNFTIDGDIHKYIVIKADLPANISKIAAYLYNTDTQANNYMYGWANNDNSIQAGITTGTNTYALRLSEAHTKSGGPDTQVADGTYNKLEIRFICNAALSEQVISVDYVAISGYNKDAVLCGGNNTTSVVGADEKPVIISGLNIGSNDYALNETDKGYTECGMSSGYESLETANITATAAIGWTVNNTATTVTTLENHKVVDAVVTATNGSETKTVSYRYVFNFVETTGNTTFSTTTYRVASEVKDKSVGDDGSFGNPTAWSYDGTAQETFFPIRRYKADYASNAGGGRDENIGITTFDFSSSKDFADKFVVSYNMWAGTDVLPSVYLVPDNATNISDCILLGKIIPMTANAWVYSNFDVTSAVKDDDDGIITLGIYIPDTDYASMSNRALQIQHDKGTRQSFAYGTIDGLADLANVPNNTAITAKRTVVEGTAGAPVSIVPIIAHYGKDGDLIKATIGTQTPGLTGSSTVLSVTLENFNYDAGAYLKVFYWNNLIDIVPVLDAQELQ